MSELDEHAELREAYIEQLESENEDLRDQMKRIKEITDKCENLIEINTDLKAEIERLSKPIDGSLGIGVSSRGLGEKEDLRNSKELRHIKPTFSQDVYESVIICPVCKVVLE